MGRNAEAGERKSCRQRLGLFTKKLGNRVTPHCLFIIALLWGFSPIIIHFPVLEVAWIILGLFFLLLINATWRPIKPRRHTHPENIHIPEWMSDAARYSIARAMNNGELLVAYMDGNMYHLMTLQQLEAHVHPNFDSIRFCGRMTNEFYHGSLTPDFIRWCYYQALRGKAAETPPDIMIEKMIGEFMAICEPPTFFRTLHKFTTEISIRLDRATGVTA